MQTTEIKNLIENTLLDCTTIIEGDDGVHFNAVVISQEFTGKNRLQRQRMVYAALGDKINNGTIHAISFKTFTPTEWTDSQ